MPLKVAVLHTLIRLGAKRSNIKKISELVAKALSSNDSVDLVVLPPYPSTGPIVGYYPDQKVPYIIKSFAERISEAELQLSPTLNMISRVSEEFGVYTVAGPIVERAGPRLYLTTVVTGPEGRLVAKYRKIALTKKEQEAGLTPGKDVATFEVKDAGMRVGLVSDEDINYPEVLRALYYGGADLVIGTMLPYHSAFLKMRSEPGSGVLTLDIDQVIEVVNVRSRENGFSMILVGGAVEGGNGAGLVAFMPTLIAEPEQGVVRDKIRMFDDLDVPVFVEVTRSIRREASPFLSPVLKSMCKGAGASKGEEEQEVL